MDKFTMVVFMIAAYGVGNMVVEADWTPDPKVDNEWIFQCMEDLGWYKWPECSRWERRFGKHR
jgi:hypothetical protein